jgi:GTP-binding protein
MPPVPLQFLQSAQRVGDLPDSVREVAVVGRSNVGKSSLINAFANRTSLARVSKTPGRTQLINIFEVSPGVTVVDLPGYGYAKVPRGFQDQWRQLIESYLSERPTLQLCFLVLDARRGWMEKDLVLKGWLEMQNRPYQVIVTKMDKLNQAEQQRGLAAIRKISPHAPLPFSALDGRGVREIWQAITKTHRN